MKAKKDLPRFFVKEDEIKVLDEKDVKIIQLKKEIKDLRERLDKIEKQLKSQL